MSYNSLKIKDGIGELKSVAVVSSSDGFYPVHVIDPDHTVTVKTTEEERAWVTGSVNIQNFPSVQTITASLNNRLGITGSVTVNSFPQIQKVSSSYDYPINEQKARGSSVSEVIKTTYLWNGDPSGTFNLADLDYNRKELMIHNTGPGILYIKVSSESKDDLDKHGFTLVNTASAPSVYNFVVYPSGTYLSSEASRVFYHGGYFVSSSATGTVVATSIS